MYYICKFIKIYHKIHFIINIINLNNRFKNSSSFLSNSPKSKKKKNQSTQFFREELRLEC